MISLGLHQADVNVSGFIVKPSLNSDQYSPGSQKFEGNNATNRANHGAAASVGEGKCPGAANGQTVSQVALLYFIGRHKKQRR